MLGLPLLIAWKFDSVWTLFDIRDAALASRNFNIRFDQAMGQNLLGVLAGDLAYRLQPGAGIHLRINKEELLSTQPSDDGYPETWKMRIGAVDFTRAGGERWALHAETNQLLATWELESREDHHADHIIHSFVVPEETNVQFAHRALVQLLTSENQNVDSTGWRALLSVPEITRTIGRLSEALDRGLQEGGGVPRLPPAARTYAGFSDSLGYERDLIAMADRSHTKNLILKWFDEGHPDAGLRRRFASDIDRFFAKIAQRNDWRECITTTLEDGARAAFRIGGPGWSARPSGKGLAVTFILIIKGDRKSGALPTDASLA